MKTHTRAVVLIAVAALASYGLRPADDLKAAEKPQHLLAQAQAAGPTTTRGKSLDVITEPNPPVPLPGGKMFYATIKAGIAQSQDGRRAHGLFKLDLLPGDIVSLTVPSGEPAAELSGGITYSLKPEEQIYIQARGQPGDYVFIAVDGRNTDKIFFNTK